jgi:quercetin dioxygenase-like cupin family protein
MNMTVKLFLMMFAMAFTVSPAAAQDAKPEMRLRQTVEGMPRGEKQQVMVLTANLKPGDKTPFHTHRFPVTVYIMEGTFTLEMEGHQPVVLNAGDSFVEPPNVKMTGYNRSASGNMKVVIVYVSDPDTPFLDMIH